MEKSNSVKNPIVPGVWVFHIWSVSNKQIYGKSNRVAFACCKKSVEILKRYYRLGIFYQKRGNGELITYTDSDYAGDIDDRKSTSGYVFLRCPLLKQNLWQPHLVLVKGCG